MLIVVRVGVLVWGLPDTKGLMAGVKMLEVLVAGAAHAGDPEAGEMEQ
jgi:hypothetical protein